MNQSQEIVHLQKIHGFQIMKEKVVVRRGQKVTPFFISKGAVPV